MYNDDYEAVKFLESRGYVLTSDFNWIKPNPQYKPTAEESKALDYLWLEWDYGDVTTPPSR